MGAEGWIRLKDYVPFSFENIRAKYEGKYPYEIDGLIFNQNYKYYESRVYKWKPPNLLTLDFLIKRPLSTMVGLSDIPIKKGYDVYLLFCGIRADLFKSLRERKITGYNELFADIKMRSDYFPMHFLPNYLYYHPIQGDRFDDASVPLDLNNQIGEFILEDGQWKLVRLRYDKLKDAQEGLFYGNDYKTCKGTWDMIHNPLTLDDLCNPGKMYFMKSKSSKHVAMTNFNSFVKSMLTLEVKYNPINTPQETTVIDLASGKGQDIFRYLEAGVGTLVAVDIDQDALDELEKRRLSAVKGHTQVMVKKMDLSQPFTQSVAGFASLGVERCNFIFCNFAIHYLISSAKSLDNLVGLVDKMLIPGGKFVFTCFDGRRVYDLVSGTGKYESKDGDGGVPSYSIEKKFSGDKFETYGQKISVKLPFSPDPYEEYLVDIDNVISHFEKKGYEVEKHSSFSYYLPKFKINNEKVYSQLTDDDKKFVSLYSYVSVWKS